jgi:hypothetical protein
VTVRCSVDLAAVGRLLPAPFVSGDGRAIAWLEAEADGARVALYGPAEDMRALAAAAITAAQQAEEFGGVGEQLRTLAGATGTG